MRDAADLIAAARVRAHDCHACRPALMDLSDHVLELERLLGIATSATADALGRAAVGRGPERWDDEEKRREQGEWYTEAWAIRERDRVKEMK